MWRPISTMFRKVVITSINENLVVSRNLFSTRSRSRSSASKLTLISAGVGIMIGAGYGGYTHYKVNAKRSTRADQSEEYAFLKKAPEYKPHYRIVNDSDLSNIQLVLFQYRTCPFCCKVRSYLDSRGISYEIVEVDAVLRQAIKWSGYKKVPIVLAKVDGGYQQLLDSTAIISILETYIVNKDVPLSEIIKFYPANKHFGDSGKSVIEIANKYFVMYNTPIIDDKDRFAEIDERKWRKWADNVLVHTLSPNVYRTPAEALETFKWFEEAGGWKQSFPAWECALMVYVGAAAMYFIAKRLKKRHNIKDDVRHSLYVAANNWIEAVDNNGSRFLGGDVPNLADITVYGVLSSIEGCQAFQDLRDNTKIGKWYDDVKSVIESRMGKVIAIYA